MVHPVAPGRLALMLGRGKDVNTVVIGVKSRSLLPGYEGVPMGGHRCALVSDQNLPGGPGASARRFR